MSTSQVSSDAILSWYASIKHLRNFWIWISHVRKGEGQYSFDSIDIVATAQIRVSLKGNVHFTWRKTFDIISDWFQVGRPIQWQICSNSDSSWFWVDEECSDQRSKSKRKEETGRRRAEEPLNGRRARRRFRRHSDSRFHSTLYYWFLTKPIIASSNIGQSTFLVNVIGRHFGWVLLVMKSVGILFRHSRLQEARAQLLRSTGTYDCHSNW